MKSLLIHNFKLLFVFNALIGKCSNHVLSSNGQIEKGRAKYVQETSGEEFSSDFEDDETSFTYVDGIERRDSSVTKKRQFLPEYKKLLVSETCTIAFNNTLKSLLWICKPYMDIYV